MKINRLSLSNLASLSGEQEICFTSEPLAQAGLIAITGKTGAGKSTLLDAMCLALFDQIPRLTGAMGTLQDASGQGIAIKDAKHILRRGCVKGYAEVEFIALDQKCYLARWEIRRARNKADGNLKVDRFVKCLDDGRVLTQKISECTPCIQQLIGLSFEQFTRAVLLAQSEVGAFLKAKDQDRADLLEYLTNSNIFSLVGQAAFEKTKSFKLEYEKIEALIGHIELLSEADIQVLNQEKQQLQRSTQKIMLQQKTIETAQQWYIEQEQQEQQLDQLNQQLKALQEIDIQAEKSQLEHLDQFIEIRSSYHSVDQAIQEKQAYQHQLEQLESQNIQVNYEQAKQKYHNIQQQLNIELEHQHTLMPIVQQAYDLDTRRLHLLEDYQSKQKEIDVQQQKISDVKQAIFLSTQALEQHCAQQQNAKNQIAQLGVDHLLTDININLERLAQYQTAQQKIEDISQFKQQLQENEQLLKQTSQQHGTLEIFEQQVINQEKKLQQLHQQHHHANILQRSLKAYETALDQHQQYTQKIKQHQAQQHILAKDIQTQELTYQQATKALQHLQQFLQHQKLIHAKDVVALRQQLKEQQPCMVCGSLEHPFAETALEKLQNQQEYMALNHQKHCFEQWQNSKQALMQCQSDLIYLQKSLPDLEPLSQQVQQDFKATGFKSIDHFDTEFEQLNLQIEKLEHLNREDHLTLKHYQTLNQQSLYLQSLLPYYDRINQLKQVLFVDDTPCEQLINNLNLAAQLQNNLIENQKNYDDHQNQISQFSQKLESLTEQNLIFEQQLEHIKSLGLKQKTAILDLLAQYTSAKTPQDWQQQIQSTKQKLELEHQQALQQNKLLEQQYQQYQQDLVRTQDQILMWDNQLQTHLKKQAHWLKLHPNFDTQMIDFCRHQSAEDHQNLRQKLQKIQQDLQQIIVHIQVITDQNKAHQQKKPKDSQHNLKQQLIDLNQLVQQYQLQNNEIDSRLLNHQQAQEKQQSYQTQIEYLQTQINRWGKISQLIGSSDGAKFKRIAQEHHLDILVEYANQQLQPLAPRYQLKRISDSLGLAVIDHDMNSEIRPVLSLSGGETFLVSLALALAIANMASGSMKLESLFIDEGFGTLDPTSLHIVMDALDRLQSQGRKVVLISHVQEMHERIPVQIQVKSTGAGTSQVFVVG